MFTLTVGLSTVTVNVLTLSVASATISVNAITMGGLLANIIYYRFPRSIAFANTSLRLKHQNGCHIWNNFQDVYTNRSTCSYIKFHQASLNSFCSYLGIHIFVQQLDYFRYRRNHNFHAVEEIT